MSHRYVHHILQPHHDTLQDALDEKVMTLMNALYSAEMTCEEFVQVCTIDPFADSSLHRHSRICVRASPRTSSCLSG